MIGFRRRRPQITVYTRTGCKLCVVAERIVHRVAYRVADVDIVNVDADPELIERYTLRVPVVAVDGVELFEYEVDADQLRTVLRHARRTP